LHAAVLAFMRNQAIAFQKSEEERAAEERKQFKTDQIAHRWFRFFCKWRKVRGAAFYGGFFNLRWKRRRTWLKFGFLKFFKNMVDNDTEQFFKKKEQRYALSAMD